MFPNAIAESVRRSAQLRGQWPDRLEVRDPGDQYPQLLRVSPSELCSTLVIAKHEPGKSGPKDPFCRGCDRLVESR